MTHRRFLMMGEVKLTQKPPPVYKYDEDRLLSDIRDYIDDTYDQHYSHNNFQATEFIMDSGHGEGFCIGNIMKYAQRYGKKNGKDRKDLLKVVHYGIMALHNHDKEHENQMTLDLFRKGFTNIKVRT